MRNAARVAKHFATVAHPRPNPSPNTDVPRAGAARAAAGRRLASIR
jgi:hypothetical protein